MKKETLMSLFIAVIMITSIFGIVLNYSFSESKIRQKGLVFKIEQNYYTTEINNNEMNFYNLPDSVESMKLPEQFITQFKNTKMIYLTQDINDTLVESIAVMAYDLSTNLFETDNVYVQPGTTEPSQLPEISCKNATSIVPVIYVKSSNESLSYENNCLTINVQSEYDVARYRDLLLYKFYGII